jgi:tetratricopeptide (TPR) repeat protein
MLTRVLIGALLLSCAVLAQAQSPRTEIRVIGEHRPVAGDTPDLAGKLARLDAQRKAWTAVAGALQAHADLKALRLTATHIEAYAAVLIDLEEQPLRPGAPSAPLQAPLLVGFDTAETVRRIALLHKDPDASLAVIRAWTGLQQLREQVANQTRRRAGATGAAAAAVAQEQQATLLALNVKHLVARATAALARTEPSTIGGRVVTTSGRERAKQLAEAARALAPDSADVHTLMGDLAVDAEDPGVAEAEYRKALVGNELSATAHIKLAEAIRLQGKFPEAITELREALRLDPRSVLAHTDLGLILRAQGDLPGAVAEYQEAIRLDPDWADAYNGLAVTHANQRRIDLAVDEFRQMIRIDPGSTLGYYNLSIALADLDRDVEAAAALREVIRINPNHYNARYNLGEMFRLEGKFDESAKQFREYVRLAPDTPQNQRNLRRARQFIQQFSDEK